MISVLNVSHRCRDVRYWIIDRFRCAIDVVGSKRRGYALSKPTGAVIGCPSAAMTPMALLSVVFIAFGRNENSRWHSVLYPVTQPGERGRLAARHASAIHESISPPPRYL